MFDPDNLLRCDFCENGTVTKHIEQIKFRQLTDRGYIFCRAEVPHRHLQPLQFKALE